MSRHSRLAASQLGVITIAVCALAASEPSAQTAKDERVRVGGHVFHVRESGSERPVVVFENGMGEDSSTWKAIEPRIAQLTRTFCYDRAGLGQSEAPPSAHARDARQLARELRTLLRAARVPHPYVLVGHSLGGAIVQIFAHDFPADVGGLVLVDPGDGRLDKLLRTKLPADVWSAREKALAEEMPKLPVAVRKEYDAMALSGDEASLAFPLPHVPIVLLTGTKKNPEFPGNPIEQDLKLALHNELALKVPGITHLMVPESRHYIQEDAPEQVIAAIRQVLGEMQAAARKTRADRP